MPKKRIKHHGEQDSPFYKLRSKAKLASLLFLDVDKLVYFADSEDLYFDFPKKKKGSGFRSISAPCPALKTVQKRIAILLQRITPPDYLFAPVSGRSYVDNAARHLGANSIRSLDIQDFFPSCTANRVIWFFRKRMGCSPDVAALIRGIVTRHGSLPQGSPCSPILAFLCYLDMWGGNCTPNKRKWLPIECLRRRSHDFRRDSSGEPYLEYQEDIIPTWFPTQN